MEDGESKVCPFCKERIRKEAVKCRFCGEWLEPSSQASDPPHFAQLTPEITVSPPAPKPRASQPKTEPVHSPEDSAKATVGVHTTVAAASESRLPKTVSKFKRVLVITAGSLCGFVVLHFFDPKLQPHGEPVASYAAVIVGACFLPWLFGVLIAMYGRGWGSTVGGLAVVVIIDGLALVGTMSDRWVQEKPPKQQLAADVAEASAEFEGMLTNALSRSGLTPTQVSTAMAAVASVYTPITEGFQATRELEKIMTAPAFTSPINWKTRNDLAANRAVCEKYKEACARLIARTSRLKVDTIAELRRRGFNPAEASSTADIFFSDKGTDVSHEMVQIDIKLADIRIAQFDLLSSHFGQWTVKNGSPEFSDQELNNQWSKTLSEASRLKETQEALARKLVFQ